MNMMQSGPLDSQHCRHNVAWRALARLVDCNNSVFQFLAAFLIIECDLGFNRYSGQFPVALSASAPLDFVRGRRAAVRRLFPVQRQPASSLLPCFQQPRLARHLQRARNRPAAPA
ncbi:hypothetical protein LDFHOB_13365 [Candidatus Electronema aureum]